MLPNYSFSQETPRIIPDGTQGEVMVVNKKDSASNQVTLRDWKDWNKFNGPLTTLTLGGGFLYDFVTYKPDDVIKKHFDLKPTFKVRDFRLTMSGRFKFRRDVTWKAGIMYDGPSASWFVRETGIMVSLPEVSGHIFIGRTKEGFSMNKVMVGYAGWSLERQLGIDVIPILADGVKYLGYFPKQRILLNVGLYADWLSHKQSFSTYSWQSVVRLGWLPVLDERNNSILHIGLNARYGKTEENKIRVRSRPSAFAAPYFVDSDEFPADHSIHIGGEAYFRAGSLMFGSEYYAHKFNSPEKSNPVFYGGEVMASYIFTGEKRPYSTVTSIFGFVPVKKSVFKGGPGAIEGVLQLTNIDLNDSQITGGKFWRITPMVNWYLSSNVRFELAYGYGVLNRFNEEGATHFFQSRIQLSF
jgi:phosphate-selective porin OprO/OprP